MMTSARSARRIRKGRASSLEGNDEDDAAVDIRLRNGLASSLDGNDEDEAAVEAWARICLTFPRRSPDVTMVNMNNKSLEKNIYPVKIGP